MSDNADLVSLARRGRGVVMCGECGPQVDAVAEKLREKAEKCQAKADELETGVAWGRWSGAATAFYEALALLSERGSHTGS